MHPADMARRQNGGKCPLKRHLPPSRKCFGKDRRVQRRPHRHQGGVGHGAHRPANRIVDLAVDLVGQAEERRSARVLLLGCRQPGGDKETFYCIEGDLVRVSVMGETLPQPLLGFIQLALPQRRSAK